MMVSKNRIFLSILALPFVVLVVIPGIILLLERMFSRFDWLRLPLAVVQPIFSTILLLSGTALFMWTNWLFVTLGYGTLAPWDPPRKLIIEGPYHYVRNPMIISVGLMLAGEAVLFRSTIITLCIVLFILGNMIYFPLKEEKDLMRRFGKDYKEYRRYVPAWVPHLKPWKGENES